MSAEALLRLRDWHARSIDQINAEIHDNHSAGEAVEQGQTVTVRTVDYGQDQFEGVEGFTVLSDGTLAVTRRGEHIALYPHGRWAHVTTYVGKQNNE